MAFTDDGIDNLLEIIRMHKDRIMLSRSDDEK
ncbi:MAG: hypothetical protein JWP84_3626, partial [Tardiphaga sp.]|jgi:hypothetical protein|nr:hypothetical protein [Tardiphaga sp.]